MKHLFLLFLAVSLLFSCANADDEEKEYYESGKIKSITKFNTQKDSIIVINMHKNGQIKDIVTLDTFNNNGHSISYRTNGDLESKKIFLKGKLDGESVFFLNGKITERDCYRKGLLDGNVVLYYESGKIKERTKFEVLGDTIQQWQSYEQFSENGTLVKKAIRVISNVPDTVEVNKNISICVELGKQKFNKIRLILGDFDANFKLIDSLNFRQFESEKKVCGYFLFKKKGVSVLRGLIFDFSNRRTTEANETKREIGKFEYFEKRIYVR